MQQNVFYSFYSVMMELEMLLKWTSYFIWNKRMLLQPVLL